jgi:hypothetical protein
MPYAGHEHLLISESLFEIGGFVTSESQMHNAFSMFVLEHFCSNVANIE